MIEWVSGGLAVSNGNRTERSPIQSAIIWVITKSDDHAAGVQFVYHKNHNFREKECIKERENLH